MTNSCFDPYGLLSPLTVQLKIELCELYRNLGWDDDIPQEKKEIWCAILQRLKQAENVRFKRSIVNVFAVGTPELIVFCDGTPSATCAAIYVRWSLSEEEFDVRLIAVKTRVTPLERMTTPRAEIQTAVLGIRLCKTVVESLNNIKFERPIYLSDSTCTLATLSKESTVLNEYFGNRQAECLNYSDKSQWYHVSSEDNIADLGTKMKARVEDVDENSEWQNGPKWLRQRRELWPIKQDLNSEVPKEALMVKHMCHAIVNECKDSILKEQRVLARTYSFLMRTTARLFYMFEKRSFAARSVISTECLDKAEKYWIQESMQRTSIEFNKGNLNPLRPKKDKDGIISMSSRAIKGFRLHYNIDRLPILTTKDPLAYL